jgi:hypothetical protein
LPGRNPDLLNSKEEIMNKLIKILHINPSWQVIYILIRDRVLIKSKVPLEKAISMLKNEKFDLIVSEPQKIAILDHPAALGKKVPDRWPLWGKGKKFTEKWPNFNPGCVDGPILY